MSQKPVHIEWQLDERLRDAAIALNCELFDDLSLNAHIEIYRTPVIHTTKHRRDRAKPAS